MKIAEIAVKSDSETVFENLNYDADFERLRQALACEVYLELSKDNKIYLIQTDDISSVIVNASELEEG